MLPKYSLQDYTNKQFMFEYANCSDKCGKSWIFTSYHVQNVNHAFSFHIHAIYATCHSLISNHLKDRCDAPILSGLVFKGPLFYSVMTPTHKSSGVKLNKTDFLSVERWKLSISKEEKMKKNIFIVLLRLQINTMTRHFKITLILYIIFHRYHYILI